MTPEPSAMTGRRGARRAARACLCFLYAVSSIALASCQEESAFGLPASRLAAVLAARDPEPLLAVPERELESAGKLGPDAFYYLGRWLEDRAASASPAAEGNVATRSIAAPQAAPNDAKAGPRLADPEERAILLYRLAYERAAGLVRREAARALAATLARTGAAAELATFARDHRGREGPDWAVDRPALDALYELGSDEESLAVIDALRSAFPSEAASDEEALLFFEGAAQRRLGRPGWSIPIKILLFERPGTRWIAETLELLAAPASQDTRGHAAPSESPDAALSAVEYRVARMRAAVLERDYGKAYHDIAPVMESVLSPRSPPAAVADAGKAFLYSNMARQGLALFASLESRAAQDAERNSGSEEADKARQVAWNALFYHARFALSLELWPDAIRLFRDAAAGATTPADADAALWYGIDAVSKQAAAEAAKAAVVQYRGAKTKAARTAAEKAAVARGIAAQAKARRAALAALVEAAPAWHDLERSADIIDGLFREALRVRDWELISAMAEGLGGHMPSSVGARVSYVAARADELGFARAEPREQEPASASLAERFAAIAADPAAPLHYRALAAWRSGGTLELLPQEASKADPRAPEPPARRPEEESFILGFLLYGLPDLAAEEARDRLDSLAPDSVRRIAAAFISADRADGAIRLAAALVTKLGDTSLRSDYELLYPRPFLADYRAIRPKPSCPEQLLYGLLRSESLFRADIVSWAGAIGLSQLMPATAAEIAEALDLRSYDLRSARDNLRIGAAFFSELLSESGRPLRAMMAYNAGRSRLRKWIAEAGELPDDLMLEAIGIAETRQYGRNILQASVMYGELYYGVPAATTARLFVEGGEF